MNDSELGIPLWLVALIAVILLLQGTWLFMDARKRQLFPWFWGLWGLIQFPMPLLVYMIFIRWRKKRGGKEDQ